MRASCPAMTLAKSQRIKRGAHLFSEKRAVRKVLIHRHKMQSL